ncbi:hypothetical protein E2C01_006793 [Portunus trituberculatus]|uniref:Uncharacterized protein n=1 Tax=Portunus trituberculatus TaxID=210409 RepID=A0A5B7CX94_PORTR|nr:hypothetical protein [Portunus trituberculatus]
MCFDREGISYILKGHNSPDIKSAEQAAFCPPHYLCVKGEAVVDPGRQDDQVSRCDFNSDPVVLLVSHVKVTRAFRDEANLFICVKVFLKEHFDLWVQPSHVIISIPKTCCCCCMLPLLVRVSLPHRLEGYRLRWCELMLQPLVIRAVIHVPGTHHPDPCPAAAATKCPGTVDEWRKATDKYQLDPEGTLG